MIHTMFPEKPQRILNLLWFFNMNIVDDEG